MDLRNMEQEALSSFFHFTIVFMSKNEQFKE